MNANEECKGNAELEQDARPKRKRLVVAIIDAPFATGLACADLVDGVAKQGESNQEARSVAHPSNSQIDRRRTVQTFPAYHEDVEARQRKAGNL
jgi:hypothetical protein